MDEMIDKQFGYWSVLEMMPPLKYHLMVIQKIVDILVRFCHKAQAQ